MEKKEFLSKQSVRSKYLAYRDSLTKSERVEKSRRLWENLKKDRAFKEAELILAYMDYRSEVITTEFVKELLGGEMGKRVFVPKVEGMNIDFFEIASLEDLHSGYQGIREPEENKEKLFTAELMDKHNCLLLVPGAVFDRQMGRMGYGKGFYDRFIHRYPLLKKAGIAFECQMAKAVPIEAHDKNADLVVTESAVYR